MWRYILVFLLIFTAVGTHAQSDEIPNNCPYERGIYYQRDHFPRYEFHSGRVVLVDWTSGHEIREIATNISGLDYRVQTWSPECQYVAIAFSRLDERNVERWDTYVWDVLTGTSIATFNDARLSPYPLTWDTNNTQLLVETRFGAYLWKLDGTQVWLTSEADYNARSFYKGTMRWDYANNQVSGSLSIDPKGIAVYDMSTGALLSLDGSTDNLDSARVVDAKATENGERYPCRTNRYGRGYRDGLKASYEPESHGLVIRDIGTREIVQAVDTTLAGTVGNIVLRGYVYYGDCNLLWVSFGRRGTTNIMYDLTTNQQLLMLEGYYIRQSSVDPTGQYVVVTTRNGANLYHLLTGASVPLVPDVRLSALGSGYVWSYDTIEWDVNNNQVWLGTTLSKNIYRRTPLQFQVHDIASGALIDIVDRDGESVDFEDIVATEIQRTAPFGCRWRVRYEAYNQALVLEDAVTRENMTVIEDNLDITSFTYLSKSPDCRYIAVAIGQGERMDTVIWDLVTLERASVFEDARGISHPVDWSPYGGYALVQTRDGGILTHLPDDSPVQLNDDMISDNLGRYQRARIFNFHRFEWDMANEQLLAVPVDQADRVVAYDFITGAVVGEYHIGGRLSPVDFVKLDDNQLMVYTDYSAHSYDYQMNGLALWDMTTNEGIQLVADYYLRPYSDSPYRRANPQFSPDGAKMMMRSANYVYIWDFNMPMGATPHLPNYVHQLNTTAFAHFETNDVISTCTETTSREQLVRRISELTTYTYDMSSGERLSEASETFRYSYFEFFIDFNC